jgi:hypothetical protein
LTALAKISPRRKNSGARALFSDGFLHFLEPISESAFGQTYERDSSLVFDVSQKIYFEQLPPAFPFVANHV